MAPIHTIARYRGSVSLGDRLDLIGVELMRRVVVIVGR